MRPTLGKLHGLPFSIVPALLRAAAGLGLVAVFLGRSATLPEPEPAAPRSTLPRSPAHPRYVGIDGLVFSHLPSHTPALFDTETGSVTACPVAGVRGTAQFSCSPWRDGEGQYHLLAPCLDKAGEHITVVRCTFPAGRVLDVVRLDVFPSGRLCWFPDRSDRILFAGSDRRLYVYDWPPVGDDRNRNRDRALPRPRTVQWRTRLPGVGEFWLNTPCWPGLPALSGRLLVSLQYREDGSQPGWSTHLWWLQLNPDGDAVVAAERAVVPAEPGPTPPGMAELCPSVGVARDGTPLLAYLARRGVDRDWEVWVTSIEPGTPASGLCPRVLVASGRKLAEGCGSALLAFSADARWLYAPRRAGLRYQIERYAVPDLADPPAESSDLSAFFEVPRDRSE